MTRKHTKYSQEWLDIVKIAVPKKNTTEKDDKGNVIDKTEIEVLGDKRVEIEGQITILDQEISTGKKASDKAKKVYRAYKYLEKRNKYIEDHKQGGGGSNFSTAKPYDFEDLRNNLHSGGGFNYDAKITNHYRKDDAGTGKDNMYLLTINGANQDITEEQIINVIARICHGLSNMSDVADFKAKFASWNTNATDATTMNTCLDNLIKDGKEVKKGQTFYDFTYTYTQQNLQDTAKHNIAYPNSRAYPRIFGDFYTWIGKVSGKNNGKTLAETLQKDNTHSENVPIYLKGEAWKHNELKDWFGIELNAGQTFYKTSTNSTNFAVKGGVGGWIELGEAINHASHGNRNKLLNNFTDNAPTTADTPQSLFSNLFADIGDWDEDTKSWKYDGTNRVGLESVNLDSAGEALDELAVQKDLEVQDVALSNREVSKKQAERIVKQTKKDGLDTKIQELITDEIGAKRTKIAEYKITDGFELVKKSDGTVDKDNRKSLTDLKTIKNLLEDIRFLENADDEAVSSVDDENTAYTAVKELLDKWSDSRAHWFDLEEGTTNADKAKKIKDKNANDLQNTHDSFETWENKVKFDDKLKQQLKDIKIALGKSENPMDTLKTYQDKLKALDPVLTDTVITQAIVDDWKTQNNFKTAESMETELKKIFKDGALDADFKKAMTKLDSEITDVANLLTKKKAKEVITLIRRWEYDENTDADKRKKLVWTLELKDPKDDKKYLEDKELSDKEINDVLYEIAVGTKTLASQKKADETSDDTGNPNEEKLDSWFKFGKGNYGKPSLFYGGIFLAIIIICVIVFWKNLQEWWAGPKDEDLGSSSDSDEKDGEE